MTNRQKYKNLIDGYEGNDFCADVLMNKFLKSDECDADCVKCLAKYTVWLDEEYKEDEVDWTQVPANTPIEIKDNTIYVWMEKYFSRYRDGLVYYFNADEQTHVLRNEFVAPESFARLIEG